jgi:hypothetical protein
MLFETLRTMSKARPFKLVFLLQLPRPPSRGDQQRFELTLAAVTEKGLLDFLDSPPIIRSVEPYPLVHPYP